MANKNDYSVVVFMEEGQPKKWTYVHNLGGFASFLNKSHPTWKYFNVYNRRDSKYLKRFYKGNLVPPFLALIIFALTGVVLSTFNKPLNSTFNNTRSREPLNSTFNKNPLLSPLNDFNNTATITTYRTFGGGAVC